MKNQKQWCCLSLFFKHCLISGHKRSLDGMALYVTDINRFLPVRDASSIFDSQIVKTQWMVTSLLLIYASEFTSAVFLRQEADKEIMRMETEAGELTNDNRVGTLERPWILHHLPLSCWKVYHDKLNSVFSYLSYRTNSFSICWRLLKDWLRILHCNTEILSITSSTVAVPSSSSHWKNVISWQTQTLR